MTTLQDAGTDIKEVYVEVYDAGKKKVLSSSEKAQAHPMQIDLTQKKGTLQLPIDDKYLLKIVISSYKGVFIIYRWWVA